MSLTDRELRDFLTGRAPDDLLETIEQEALRDPETFEQLTALEDELVFDYARGLLTPPERQWLETHTLAVPGANGRVAEAKSMLAAFDRMAHPAAQDGLASRAMVWAGLAAAAALILGLGLETWRLRNELTAAKDQLARVNSEVERLAQGKGLPSRPPETPAAAPLNGPVRPIVAVSLTPSRVRSASAPAVVNLPADPLALLEFRLTLPAGTPRPPYQFTVTNADGRIVARGSTSPAAGGAVNVQVPARQIPSDDYEIVLSTPDGAEAAAYAVSVR